MEAPIRSPHRLLNYEDCQGAINCLFQDALKAGNDGAFIEFLTFATRFSNLSVYNAMLVRVQQPGTTAVATARKWAEIERYPKPGASPLVILQPFGPVSFIYAMEDTEGREIVGADKSSLFATGTASKIDYDRISTAAGEQSVRVTQVPFGSCLAGFAQEGHRIRAKEIIQREGALRWEVVVNANLDQPSRFATLAHELGHVYCGHLGGHPEGRWNSRRGQPHAERELEAEAVAWLVSTRNNVLPRSEQYLADYARRADLERVSMFSIYDAANRIESRSYAIRKSKGR